MSSRRILSLWFPRLGAEQLLRRAARGANQPLAIVGEQSNTQVIISLTVAASIAGVYPGQSLRDARAICADLVTRSQNAPAETAFLAALARWAGKFSPWVSVMAPNSLVIDLTGCSHLFGGEISLLDQINHECAEMGLTVFSGIGDTLGAAWALARFAGQGAQSHRTGDSIAQEAPATRAKAAKRRHWTKGGSAPLIHAPQAKAVDAQDENHHWANRIAPFGAPHAVLAPLPVAALRLSDGVVEHLNRLGLRRISDLMDQPRAGLARRFGKELVLKLDQALGSAPEPISPAPAEERFAMRLTLPEPIGLKEDLLAGIDRLLHPMCEKLDRSGRAARVIRLEIHLVDGAITIIDVALARAGTDPNRIRPLFELKTDNFDAGFGVDLIRLEAIQHEASKDRETVGHLEAGRSVMSRLGDQAALEDLIGKLGARLGMDAITRRHPTSSHTPENTSQIMAAAWSEPAKSWPAPANPRPILMWRPEPMMIPDSPSFPDVFRWRGRDWQVAHLSGHERIAPEWWLDIADWRNGVRDYYIVTTRCGSQLWVFYAHGATLSAGWFCHGNFG